MSIREFRAALTDLEQHLSEHGEIILTRHGKEIARIGGVSTQGPERLRDLSEFREKMSEYVDPDMDWADLLDGARGRY